MKKKLYLVRHGQTLFNEKKRVQGWCDSPLTEKGHAQARKTRQYFKDHGIEFDHAYCSTLPRTEATLKDITDLPYTRMEDLREFHYGDLEGELVESIRKPIDLDTFYKQHGGETRQEVEARMDTALRSIMDKDDVQSALVVSHGSSSFRFASLVDPIKAKKLRKFANCLIYEFDYEDGRFTLENIIDEHVKEPEGK